LAEAQLARTCELAVAALTRDIAALAVALSDAGAPRALAAFCCESTAVSTLTRERAPTLALSAVTASAGAAISNGITQSNCFIMASLPAQKPGQPHAARYALTLWQLV
jgi:hypothetical protein